MDKTLLYEQQVLTVVQRQLTSARRFKIATAMVSSAGMDYIRDSIRRCLQKGGSGEILIGIDLPTDPKALGELLQIQSKHAGQLELKTFRRLKRRIFHPKLFIFEGSGGNKSRSGWFLEPDRRGAGRELRGQPLGGFKQHRGRVVRLFR